VKAARAEGRDDAFIDRLTLTAKAIEAMAEGLREIAKLPTPWASHRPRLSPSGIQVGRMRVPLGVIGIIYESRPNVTADAGGLCLKSGNACILRGGSESLQSNQAIAACLALGLKAAGLPRARPARRHRRPRCRGRARAPGEVTRRDRAARRQGPHRARVAGARVPVIKHLDGICHVYIDDRADARRRRHRRQREDAALRHVQHDGDAARRAGDRGRGAAEIGRIYAQKGVEMRCCPESRRSSRRPASTG
jgi:glutamate-5-semialdehyde dehydrogenase